MRMPRKMAETVRKVKRAWPYNKVIHPYSGKPILNEWRRTTVQKEGAGILDFERRFAAGTHAYLGQGRKLSDQIQEKVDQAREDLRALLKKHGVESNPETNNPIGTLTSVNIAVPEAYRTTPTSTGYSSMENPDGTRPLKEHYKRYDLIGIHTHVGSLVPVGMAFLKRRKIQAAVKARIDRLDAEISRMVDAHNDQARRTWADSDNVIRVH